MLLFAVSFNNAANASINCHRFWCMESPIQCLRGECSTKLSLLVAVIVYSKRFIILLR